MTGMPYGVNYRSVHFLRSSLLFLPIWRKWSGPSSRRLRRGARVDANYTPHLAVQQTPGAAVSRQGPDGLRSRAGWAGPRAHHIRPLEIAAPASDHQRIAVPALGQGLYRRGFVDHAGIVEQQQRPRL